MDISDLHHPATYVIAVLTIAFCTFKIGTWAGGVNELKNRTYDVMDEIREDIKKILAQIDPNKVHCSIGPIQLNELGKIVSSELAADEWAKGESPNLIEVSRGKEEFEIYDLCFKYVHSTFEPSEEMKTKMRQVAYQHNIYSEKVLAVLVLELRDCMLGLQSTGD